MTEQGVTVNEAAQTPQVPTTMHRRALDILGLNRPHIMTTQRSLKIEVETYLNSNDIHTKPLVFWQVCMATYFRQFC